MENQEYQNPYNESEVIDFQRYISLFISNWYLFAAALFISMTIAYGVNRYSEEIYTVQSSILIKDEQYAAGFADMNKIIPGGDIFQSTQNLENEIGILGSFNLNYRVMKSLPEFHVVYIGVGRRGIAESRLYKTSPFVVRYDSLETMTNDYHIWVKVLSPRRYYLYTEDHSYSGEHNFGDVVNVDGMKFSLVDRKGIRPLFVEGESNKYYFYFINPAKLANEYRSKLSVTPINENATLVTLSVSGPSPQQEADYLNRLMELYNQQGLEYKNETARKTIEFIDAQLLQIADSLQIAEDDLENFRLSNNLVDLSLEGSIGLQKLDRFEGEKAELMMQLEYYKYLLSYIETKNQSGSIISPNVFVKDADPVLVSLIGELSDLQQKLKQVGFIVNKDTPAEKLMIDRIDQIRASITENVNNSINQTNNSLGDLSERINDVHVQMRKLPVTERRLVEIQRSFDLNNTVYTFLLEKRAEAGISKASTVSDNRTIDTADPYNALQIFPKTKKNYMLGFIIGLILPAIAIVIIDLLNNKIIDKKDIEKITRTPIVGYISHSAYNTEIPVVEKPGSTLSESFRSIRTSLRYFMTEEKPMVIGISSTISGEGKTFVAVNLASIISMLDKKTLLVGLDLRKPRIHRILGLDNKAGMSSYLSNTETFENIIRPTQIENLWYAAAGPIAPNPAELIERKEMTTFLQEAKKRFDYIILDTPPVAIVTDALLLAPHADVMLFVVRQRYSSRSTLHLIEEIRRSKEMHNIGIIVNDISMSGYYGYGLRYGYAMGYYYGYNYGYKYYGQSYYGRKDEQAGEYYTND